MLRKKATNFNSGVCLARWESEYDSSVIGKLNWDGSEDHGLFQISDKWWCARKEEDRWDKGCLITCDKLRDDDLEDDIRCVKTIYQERKNMRDCGFCAWTAWKDKCQPGSHFLREIQEELRKCDDKVQRKDDKEKVRRTTNLHFIPYMIHHQPVINGPFMPVPMWIRMR